MSIFYQEQTSKKCKCLLALALKDAFTKCYSFRSPQPDEPITNFDEDEEEVFVSVIISKYMESKSKRKTGFIWALSPAAVPKPVEDGENGDEFWSACSQLSRCSSDTSFDVFVSAKACLSRCSSLGRIDSFRGFGDYERRSSIMKELVHCEGWPFGLCRKALLLPPLPKSPADSWLWRKRSGRAMRIYG